MSSENIVIEVEGASKRYEIYNSPLDRLKQMLKTGARLGLRALGVNLSPGSDYFREFWALRDVSFVIRQGETFGIVGRNGSGKSTLLQLIAGTMAPTSGSVVTRGRIAALLELGSGFNPEFTGRQNVYINSAILGLSRAETHRRLESIIEFAEIGEFFDQPVKTYSSGMFLRLAFAVQAHVDASIVLIDEALAVGDVFFRQKCYQRLEQMRASGAAIILVSHSMPDIEQFCQRAVVLDHGVARFLGSAVEATKHYYLFEQEGRVNTSRGDAAPKEDGGAAAQPRHEWEPARQAYLDLSEKPQITNGSARCVGVAICDVNGEPKASFKQAETAIFRYEFEILKDMGAAIGGLVLSNDKGIIVHGRNSWQFADAPLISPKRGDKIAFTQEVVMDLAPGGYVLEVGLAAVAIADWHARAKISHEEMSSRHVRLCHVPGLGPLYVGLALSEGIATLTHHGVANLPSRLRCELVKSG